MEKHKQLLCCCCVCLCVATVTLQYHGGSPSVSAPFLRSSVCHLTKAWLPVLTLNYPPVTVELMFSRHHSERKGCEAERCVSASSLSEQSQRGRGRLMQTLTEQQQTPRMILVLYHNENVFFCERVILLSEWCLHLFSCLSLRPPQEELPAIVQTSPAAGTPAV